MIYPFESSVFLIRVLPRIIVGVVSSFKIFAVNAVIVALLLLFAFASDVSAWLFLPLFGFLWLASVVDIYEQVVPDILTILMFCLLLFSGQPLYIFELFVSLAGLLGYKLMIEPRLTKEFLGWGDVKLFIAMSLFLPLSMWPLFLSGIGGAFLVGAFLLKRQTLPMVPFIAAAFWVSFLLKKI